MPLPLALPLVYEGGMMLTTLVGALYLENNSDKIANTFNGLADTFSLDSENSSIDSLIKVGVINDLTNKKADFKDLATTLSVDNVSKIERSIKKLSSSTLKHIEDSIKEASKPDLTRTVTSDPVFSVASTHLSSPVDTLEDESLFSVIKASSQINARLQEEQNKILTTISLAIQGLVAVISHSADESNKQSTLQTATLGHLVDATLESSTNVTTGDVNVVNEIDMDALTTAVSGLADHINTQERQRYHVKSADLAEYQTTSKVHTDVHGRDGIEATPAEIATMKNVAKAKGEADENDFDLDDISMPDIFPNIDLSTLFAFQGLATDLESLGGDS